LPASCAMPHSAGCRCANAWSPSTRLAWQPQPIHSRSRSHPGIRTRL